MKREDLSPEKQREYDDIIAEMTEYIESQQKNIPLSKSGLSCAIGNEPYRRAQEKYLPKLQALFK